ncbi:MAG: hypothetical protein AAF846_23475 [Chloroflexota bacterium]
MTILELETKTKSKLLNIAKIWIGQTKNNCEDQRNEKLPRYHLIGSTGYHYELRLWIGTTIGVDCDQSEIAEDWTEPSPPISKNATNGVLGIIVGSREENNEQRSFYLHTYDQLNILPSDYNSVERSMAKFEFVNEILIKLEALISENRPEV